MNIQKFSEIWSDKMLKNFQALKDAFSKSPIRAAPDFDSGEELTLTSDYSSEAQSVPGGSGENDCCWGQEM